MAQCSYCGTYISQPFLIIKDRLYCSLLCRGNYLMSGETTQLPQGYEKEITQEKTSGQVQAEHSVAPSDDIYSAQY